MGSSKNKSPAQTEKSQNATKKSKKKDESSGPPKAEIVVILTDQKYLKGAKGKKSVFF